MRELIDLLGAADIAYYRDDNPSMTDREAGVADGFDPVGVPNSEGVRRNSGRTSIRSAYKAHAVCK